MSCPCESNRRLRQLACRALLLAALALPAAGCSMFREPKPPHQPETVSEWMKQPRVGEAPAAHKDE